MLRGIAFVLVALWLAITPAAAQGLPGRAVAVCVAPVRAGDTAAVMLASPGRFTCDRAQTGFGAGDFWVMAASLPAATGLTEPAHVRSASLWQRGVGLWARYADGAVAHLALDGQGLSRHVRLGAIVDIALPARGVPVTRLLWRIDGSANLRGVLNGTTVATPGEAAAGDLIFAAIYAAFAGLCVAMLIHNLALWAALRHPCQISYCLMVAALLVYALSSSGTLAWLLPGIANNDRMRVNYLALALAAAAALAFARSFFDRRVFSGWLGGATRAVTGALVLAGAARALAPGAALRALDDVYSLAFVSLFGIVGPVLWRAWHRRDRYLGLFALAWGAPVLLALLRTASSLRLIGWSLWLDNSTVLSMALEAVLSSLAIAYRTRRLSHERDVAREHERIAQLLADTDPLTGLLNRRAFLREAIGRPGEHLLFLADIDHFKAVNDALGHDGGDEVLRAVARALRHAVPAGTLVARIGGEEFALLAPAAVAPGAGVLLARVRDEPMPFEIAVTVSIGTCPGQLATEADWKRLYRHADRALFDAKARGRDRARTAGDVAHAA